MDFNTLCAIGAVAFGVITGAVGVRFRTLTAPRQVAKASLLALLWLVMAGVVVGLAYRDFFAVVHVTYLALTVGMPIAAVILLLTGRPFTGPLAKATRVVLIAALLAVPVGLYASHIEPFWLRVDRTAMTSPSVAGTLRVGVLSDLQTPSIGDYETSAIDKLLAEQPDIVLIPGDFWQMSPAEFEERIPEFSAVMARLAAGSAQVIAVHGNTDTVEGLQRLTQGTSVIVLDNEVIQFDIRGQLVRVGGLSLAGNPAARQQTVDQLVRTPDGIVAILLSHKPDGVLELPAASGVDLAVAGHTHGGQFALPFFGPPLTLTNVERDVAAGGMGFVNDNRIYISTGVGRERHRAPQMRFGARPSVGIIDIVNPALAEGEQPVTDTAPPSTAPPSTAPPANDSDG